LIDRLVAGEWQAKKKLLLLFDERFSFIDFGVPRCVPLLAVGANLL
jgi:hypothetical protein